MEQIAPGIHHWTALRETIDTFVSSYWIEPAGIVIDPLVPDEGLDAFSGLEQVVLTTGLHSRHAERFAEAFSIPIRAPREAAERLGDRLAFSQYDGGEELARGVRAERVGVLASDEYALYIAVGGGALSFADAIHHYDEAIGFFSDPLLGDDPQAVKDGIKARLRQLLELDFEHLLFAHGDPIVGTGKQALRAFL